MANLRDSRNEVQYLARNLLKRNACHRLFELSIGLVNAIHFRSDKTSARNHKQLRLNER
jgi:hypothetical protein